MLLKVVNSYYKALHFICLQRPSLNFCHNILRMNPFNVTVLFLYPLKTSENQRFSYAFRGYRKRPVLWNGLMTLWEEDQVTFRNVQQKFWWRIIQKPAEWKFNYLPPKQKWNLIYRQFRIRSFSFLIILKISAHKFWNLFSNIVNHVRWKYRKNTVPYWNKVPTRYLLVSSQQWKHWRNVWNLFKVNNNDTNASLFT